MKHLFTFLLYIIVSLNGKAQLDPDFGSNGEILIDYHNTHCTGHDLTVMPNDKFLFSGVSNNDLMVMKFFADGTLDPGFGNQGVYSYSTYGYKFNWVKTSMFSVSTILVYGSVNYGNNDNTFILKLLPNGTRDNTFGYSGFITIPYGNPDFNLTLTDKIIRTYSLYPNSYIQMIKSNGDPDSSFGTNSIATTNIYFGNDPIIETQADGKILIGHTQGKSYITRYHANGIRDMSFGFYGSVLVDSNNIKHKDIKLQSDGKIIYLGEYTSNKPATYTYLARFNTNGSIDSSFGGNGFIIDSIPGTDTHLSPRQAFIQPDGKILISGGHKPELEKFKMYAARYNLDGSVDSTFASGGKYIHNFNDEISMGEDIMVQSNGRVIVGGYNRKSNTYYQRFAAVGIKANNGSGFSENTVKSFVLFPNPAGDVLNLEYYRNMNEIISVAITDVTGRMVTTLNGFVETIDISNLKPGLYFFTCTSQSKKETIPFLKL